MFHLIKKDILIQKKTVLLALLYLIIFTVFISQNELIGLTASVFAVSYMLVMGACALEDKNNSDMMLISLPIKKWLIVLSKYVSLYGYAACSLLICYLLYVIAEVVHLPIKIHPVTADGVLIIFFIITLMGAIYFPLIFKFGYIKSKMANFILFFVLFSFCMSLTEETSVNQLIQQWSNNTIMIFAFLALSIILAISYSISLVFYKNREF